MEIPLTTPAVIFPTISFLFLSYTNRYLAISSRIRELYSRYLDNRDSKLRDQIVSLRRRLRIIRAMQLLGILSLFFCLVAILGLLGSSPLLGEGMFVLSLLLLCASLILAGMEIFASTHALDILLSEMQTQESGKTADMN